MATYKLLLLPGDGIGPEIMAEVEKVIGLFLPRRPRPFEIEKGLVGGCAFDAHGQAISDADMALAKSADAVLLAAVGGPKWDGVPYEVRPEAGPSAAAQGSRRSTPICAPRSAIPRSPTPPRSSAKSSRASTS